MKIYINNKNEIKDVNTTTDSSLQEIEIIEDNNPFITWSIAKICCYKVDVKDGYVTMFTPYVDSRIIEHIDKLGKQDIKSEAKIDYIAMMTDIEI